MRHPLLRIHNLPVLVFVARPRGHVRVLARHPFPRAWVAILEGQPLRIGPIAENDGITAVFDRPKNVRAQHDAIVHCDRHVPIDPHAVADFAFVSHERARRVDQPTPARFVSVATTGSTPQPGPSGTGRAPSTTSRPANGSLYMRVNSPSSQA